LASVTVEDVRDVLNLSQADVPDAKVAKMIKRAEVTLGLELGKEVSSADCLDAEKEFITLLVAVYAFCYLTGGSAAGLSFSVGDQSVTLLDKAPPLAVLQAELERLLAVLKKPQIRSA